jgi:hypothetical protein
MDRKYLPLVFVGALVVFFLITQPTASAEVIQAVLGWLKDGAAAINGFAQDLFG